MRAVGRGAPPVEREVARWRCSAPSDRSARGRGRSRARTACSCRRRRAAARRTVMPPARCTRAVSAVVAGELLNALQQRGPAGKGVEHGARVVVLALQERQPVRVLVVLHPAVADRRASRRNRCPARPRSGRPARRVAALRRRRLRRRGATEAGRRTWPGRGQESAGDRSSSRDCAHLAGARLQVGEEPLAGRLQRLELAKADREAALGPGVVERDHANRGAAAALADLERHDA